MGRVTKNPGLVGSLWKQIVRWRKMLAFVSVVLLCTQLFPVLVSAYRKSLTPFHRGNWMANRYRRFYVDDLSWNQIRKGDTTKKVEGLLGKPDLYDSGDSGEVGYNLGDPDGKFDGIFRIDYGPQGVEGVWADLI
jgi:hypothetical protein